MTQLLSALRWVKGAQVASLSLATVLSSGCSGTPAPCFASSQCSDSDECLAGRCEVRGKLPVEETAQRNVSLPTMLQVFDGGSLYTARSSTPLHNGVELHLRLPIQLRRASRVLRASLHLDVAEVVRGGPPLALEAALLAPPARKTRRMHVNGWRVVGFVKGKTRIQLDVTSLVQRALDNARTYRGIAVRARDSDEHMQVALSTMQAGTTAPALDIYWVKQ